MADRTENLIRIGMFLVLLPAVIGVVAWLAVIGLGILWVSPFGIISFAFAAGIIVLLFVVIRERLNSDEDNYYSRNIDE